MHPRRYWLMKSEPHCFSFSDLMARTECTEHWDGVRNYQARNLLRDEIQLGDGVLFYHSGGEAPAIVGIARVVRAGYPDYTARDPRSDHFDPRATEADPRWFMVDIQGLEALPVPLVRGDLQRHPDLCGMAVLKKGNRLSVQEVTENEWRTVLAVGGVKNDGI